MNDIKTQLVLLNYKIRSISIIVQNDTEKNFSYFMIEFES